MPIRGQSSVPFDTAPLISAVNELSLRLGLLASTSASSTPSSQSFTASFFANLFARITAWLGSAENGIKQFFADVGNFGRVNTTELCMKDANGETCLTRSQVDAALSAAAARAAPGGTNDAPDGSSAPEAISTDATSTLNGNNPIVWQLNTPWQDNLGALFTRDGASETIYSTSTVDTTLAGTTTIDYWALVPSSQEVLHATRDVVVEGAANDNVTTTPKAANDNSPITPMAATGTDVTSTAMNQ
jgi:hypothetical protein